MMNYQEILNKENIPHSLLTICVGYNLGLVSSQDAIDYIVEHLDENSLDFYDYVLSISSYLGEKNLDQIKFQEDMDELVKAIIKRKQLDPIQAITTEQKKWRFVLLFKLLLRTLDAFDLHDEIIDIYYRFKTPSDMGTLINLIPHDEKQAQLDEMQLLENQQDRLKRFLDEEKKELSSISDNEK